VIESIAPNFGVTYDGATLNVYHPARGQGLPKHEHSFSHLTMCKEGRELVMTKDTQPVNLVANEWHEIEALEDGTVFVNVFSEGKY
jgi:quercetin dioxygenase-like cupin family protein